MIRRLHRPPPVPHMPQEEEGATPPGLEALVRRRLHLALSSTGGPDGGFAADLAEMEARGAYTGFVGDGGRTGSVVTRLARRVLHRLLYPVLLEQERQAQAASRVATQLAGRVRVLEKASPHDAPTPEHESLPPAAFPSTLSLEAAFRGPEETIRARQEGYLSHFAGSSDVVDVGCGRGEFLTLLRDAGVSAVGVDSDLDMVQHCRERGLAVEHGDGVAFLRSLEPASIGGVFCAQVVEHLTATQVVELVDGARRALRPGGVLLVESVNPQSVAALADFFLDLTHVRPYDARSIAALLAELGFSSIDTAYSLPVELRDRVVGLVRERLRDDEALQSVAVDVVERLYGDRAYAVSARAPG